VVARAAGGGLNVELSAAREAVKSLALFWSGPPPSGWKYLGDAWERAYGDLEWKPLDANRVMPWYFLASNGELTHACGVATSPSALCHWTVDGNGITLHLDVRCGGSGVQLGRRRLEVCTVLCRPGRAGETAFAAAQAFCHQMCSRPRLPREPVYGFNDWYCAYGNDTADGFLKDTAFLVSLAPKDRNRPFAVIDEGWEERQPAAKGGQCDMWDHLDPKFSPTLDMPELARRIRAAGACPGLWYRPLLASPGQPQEWRLMRDANILDPTVPEVRAYLRRTVQRFRGWHYDLVKHDYTSYDLLGKWGMEMGAETTTNGWAFRDRSHTTAEIIRGLYLDLRGAAGKETLLLGCNTIGHLAAGIFELQRVGDDTSGREWDRTRKMGVNSLAFRAPQHGTFFAIDADCVGQVTAESVPWDKNKQWLDLVAHSGTPLFASFSPDTVSPAQEQALRSAYAAASRPQPLAEPLDWQTECRPTHWRLDGSERRFKW